MTSAQLALRFLLEIAAVVAAGIAGASIGSPTAGLPGGLVAAALLVVIWGLFLAPRARFPQPAIVRLVVGTAVLEVPVIGLALLAAPLVGGVLAILVLVNALALAMSGAAAEEAGVR